MQHGIILANSSDDDDDDDELSVGLFEPKDRV